MGLERIDTEHGILALVDDIEGGMRAAVFDLDGPPHQRILVARWSRAEPQVANVDIDLPNRTPDQPDWKGGPRTCPPFDSAIDGSPDEPWRNARAAFAAWALKQAAALLPKSEQEWIISVLPFTVTGVDITDLVARLVEAGLPDGTEVVVEATPLEAPLLLRVEGGTVLEVKD